MTHTSPAHRAAMPVDAPPVAPHRPSTERGRHRGALAYGDPNPTPPTLELLVPFDALTATPPRPDGVTGLLTLLGRR